MERVIEGIFQLFQYSHASLNSADCLSVPRVSWAATADPIMIEFPLDQIAEGDVFIYNDVYGSTGTIGHLPNYCVVTPIFWDGRLIASAQIFGHVNDVGGRVPDSWAQHLDQHLRRGNDLPAGQALFPPDLTRRRL